MNTSRINSRIAYSLAVLLGLSLAAVSQAANWYVDSTAKNSENNGQSWTSAWTALRELSRAKIAPGDVVWVRGGPYDERLVWSTSGTSESPITIDFAPGTILRGLESSGTEYVRFIGARITHDGTGSEFNYGAMYFLGCAHWLVQDCQIDHTYGGPPAADGRDPGITAVDLHYSKPSNFMIFRHNTLDDIGVNNAGNSAGVCFMIVGNSNLMEYNSIGVGDDRFRVFGKGNVYRNNLLRHVDDKAATGLHHIDDLQTYPLKGYPNTSQTLYERNWEGDNVALNSHGMLLQNTTEPLGTFDWWIYRFNIIVRMGQKHFDLQGISDFYAYNNTATSVLFTAKTQFNEIAYIHPPASARLRFFNNSWSWINHSTSQRLFQANPAADDVTYDYQHSFTAGPLPESEHNLPNSDPLFMSRATDDFTLQARSPLRGKSGPATTAVSAATNSTNLAVVDARPLFDGWGIADADAIRIGNDGYYVSIASINYRTNVITLKTPQSWRSGEWVRVKGMEDVGALPYGKAMPFSVSNTTAHTIPEGAAYLTATCSSLEASSIRMVQFLVDGVPVGMSYSSPRFSTEWKSDGKKHVVEARAYNAWASRTLTTSSFVTVDGATSG